MCDFIAPNIYKQRDKNELSLMHIDSICSKIHQKRFNYEWKQNSRQSPMHGCVACSADRGAS
jgi:hypothetical protein